MKKKKNLFYLIENTKTEKKNSNFLFNKQNKKIEIFIKFTL